MERESEGPAPMSTRGSAASRKNTPASRSQRKAASAAEPGEDEYTEHMTLRMTRGQRRAIARTARKKGLPPSVFVRTCALATTDYDPELDEVDAPGDTA